MSDVIDDAELLKARPFFRSRIMKNALLKITEMSPRQLAVFRANGLLEKVVPQSLPDELVVALDPTDETARACRRPGPFVFTPMTKTRAASLPLVDAILDETQRIREAALNYLQHMRAQDDLLLSPSTKACLDSNREDILGEDPKAWREAAVKLVDKLNDDIMFNLAGLAQSLNMHYEDGCKSCFSKLILPTFRAANELSRDLFALWRDKDKADGMFAQWLADAESMEKLLDSYFETYGHLPLKLSLSMGKLLSAWLQRHNSEEEIEDRLWKWAASKGSPLARYHVCQAIASNPSVLSPAGASTFWHEASVILRPTRENGLESEWTQAWLLRCELAKHYCHHIEAVCPQTGDGSMISSMAWWFAERVSFLFGSSSDYLKSIREDIITPHIARSGEIWSLSHPAVQSSTLRCATLFVPNIWSISLFLQIGRNLSQLRPEDMGAELLSIHRDLVSLGILYGIPLQRSGDETSFAFEDFSLEDIRQWIRLDPEEGNREAGEFFLNSVKDLSSPDSFCEALKNFAETGDSDTLTLAHLTRFLAYTGNAPADGIWQSLAQEAWRDRVLPSARQTPLEVFFDALLEVQVHSNANPETYEKWHFEFPHMFALAFQKADEDSERQKLLFAMTLLSSVSGDTVSAVRRILKPPVRPCVRAMAADWRERIALIHGIAPPAVAARLRPLLAALRL